jgi:hypothetical protein
MKPDDPEFERIAALPDPRDRSYKLLKPYIGGEDLNTGAGMVAQRWIMDTDGLTEGQIHTVPIIRRLIYERVRSDFISRKELKEDDESWWNFRRPCDELRDCWQSFDRLLCLARVSQTAAFTFIDTHIIANEKIVLFRSDADADFALLQSRIHELWARFFSATMKDDLQYALTDCLENFPFPDCTANTLGTYSPDISRMRGTLAEVGRAYFDFRDALMVKNDEGLTKTYNRFHDPDERFPDIVKLRGLHAAMDRAVLDAYSWTDLKPTCEFLLEYEEDEDEDDAGGGRRRKKPWRYRWPDDFRDEVLARLIELNRQHAEEERLSGPAAPGRGSKTKQSTKGRKARTKKTDEPELFET